MPDLSEIIRRDIEAHGPIGIDKFMALALGHPQYGYYMTRDPFGAHGDFTTAPEISQMFGEIIGAWCADIWNKLGCPSPFILMEAGPGRGTLMADILRATKSAGGFRDAARIVLLETSPVLRDIQRKALSAYQGDWIESLNDPIIQSSNHPIILIANEFLDALPLRQFVKINGVWQERTIKSEDEELVFTPAQGTIREDSPARDDFVKMISRLIKQRRGTALFIDYGYEGPATGDTLQAVKNNKFHPVLTDIGNADLTAHVDFTALAHAARTEGACPVGPVSQGDFLRNLGIEARAALLSAYATENQKNDIRKALHRLTAPDQMGRLFKAMAICHGESLKPEGF